MNSNPELIDFQTLRQYIGQDNKIMAQLLEKFSQNLTELITEITAAQQSNDFQSLAAVAHKHKSSSRSVGATRLADLCEQVDQRCKNQDYAGLDVVVKEVTREAEKVAAYVQQWLVNNA
jgi:HPt (histidine-containing phosphotransfer) domain-containing protein